MFGPDRKRMVRFMLEVRLDGSPEKVGRSKAAREDQCRKRARGCDCREPHPARISWRGCNLGADLGLLPFGDRRFRMEAWNYKRGHFRFPRRGQPRTVGDFNPAPRRIRP
jgi:hypothetical protein